MIFYCCGFDLLASQCSVNKVGVVFGLGFIFLLPYYFLPKAVRMVPRIYLWYRGKEDKMGK